MRDVRQGASKLLGGVGTLYKESVQSARCCFTTYIRSIKPRAQHRAFTGLDQRGHRCQWECWTPGTPAVLSPIMRCNIVLFR